MCSKIKQAVKVEEKAQEKVQEKAQEKVQEKVGEVKLEDSNKTESAPQQVTETETQASVSYQQLSLALRYMKRKF